MAVETVLLALLGVVAVWLVVDAGRERHRLRARMERATVRAAHSTRPAARPADPSATAARRAYSRPAADPAPTGPPREGWRYWPLTVSTTEDGPIGPRL